MSGRFTPMQASPRPSSASASAGFARALAVAAIVGLATTGAGPAAAQAKAANTPQPVAAIDTRVDLDRYLGVWYEISRLPNRFQANCASNVTATYAPLSPTAIRVTNRCRRADGGEEVADGAARVQDTATNAKLEVRFLPLALSWLPFAWADYWILDLAPDYSHVLVGTPSRGFLWVLARAPQLDEPVHRRLMERAAAMGFDTARVVRTKHVTP